MATNDKCGLDGEAASLVPYCDIYSAHSAGFWPKRLFNRFGRGCVWMMMLVSMPISMSTATITVGESRADKANHGQNSKKITHLNYP